MWSVWKVTSFTQSWLTSTMPDYSSDHRLKASWNQLQRQVGARGSDDNRPTTRNSSVRTRTSTRQLDVARFGGLASRVDDHVNPLIATLKPHSNGPLYSNTVIGTLAVDGWAVTFGTASRGLGGCGPAQSPPHCTKCNSPPINGQCTNFILFDVAL